MRSRESKDVATNTTRRSDASAIFARKLYNNVYNEALSPLTISEPDIKIVPNLTEIKKSYNIVCIYIYVCIYDRCRKTKYFCSRNKFKRIDTTMYDGITCRVVLLYIGKHSFSRIINVGNFFFSLQ
jgi:hypothetical protein